MTWTGNWATDFGAAGGHSTIMWTPPGGRVVSVSPRGSVAEFVEAWAGGIGIEVERDIGIEEDRGIGKTLGGATGSRDRDQYR